MKTTVVPAQITTVEDRIAGSLTFQQIILLVMSLILGTAIYGLISPKLHLSAVKVALILIQFAFLGVLSLRIGGKILAEWLAIYLRFILRPRVYTFQKSDLSHREVVLPVFERAKKEKIKAAGEIKKKPVADVNINRSRLIDNPSVSLSIKPSKKGGLDVVIQEL